MEEIEVKFLDIDVAATEKKLAAIGAQKVGEYFYKRRIFDYPDWRLDKVNSWVRLRDEGERITLTYKKRLGVTASDGKSNDQGMEEIEIVVSDFDSAANMLLAIGLIEKFYIENKRTRWKKGAVEFDIDTWPAMPTFLEIEAPSWEAVDEAIAELGFNPADKKIFSSQQTYKLYGINEPDYKRLTFEGLVKRD